MAVVLVARCVMSQRGALRAKRINMNRFFPFHALGLRRNPFGTLSHDEWTAAAIMPEAVIVAVDETHDHVQFLGDKGHGKTTVLLTIRQHLIDQGLRAAYERIPPDRHTFHTLLDDLDVFLLDEAQRLHSLARRRLWRAATRGHIRLVLGSHADYTRWFRRRGLPLTSFDVAGFATREHLAAILVRRLTQAALDDSGPGVYFAPSAVDYLWERFGADLRATMSHLYEVFQALDKPGTLHAADLIDHAVPPDPINREP